MGKRGKREFVQVLRLLEAFPTRTSRPPSAMRIGCGAIGFDAVKHLVLCRIERRPPRLDLTVYPYLPQCHGGDAPRPATYMELLAGSGGMTRHAPGSARPSPQALKLPTFLREYDKLARQCAAEGVDHPALPAAPGRARADRSGAAHGRAPHQGGQVPGGEEPRQLRLHRHPLAQQDAGAGAGPLRVRPAPRERHRARQQRHRQDPRRARRSAWPPARRASRSASPPPPPWCTS